MLSKSILVFSIAFIAVATLTPLSGGIATPRCPWCGELASADLLSNLLLFAPFGAALATRRAGLGRSLLVAGLFSLGIELAQVGVVSGRDANVADLVANVAGAGAGWGLAQLWVNPPARAPALMLAIPAALMGLLVSVGGLLLFRPALPGGQYYLQWTARFGNMEPYLGEVRATRVGPLRLNGPPGRIAASDSVATLLARSASLEIEFTAGPPPNGLAPIVSIFDEREQELMLLGASGADLVYRVRTFGQGLRFRRPDLRFPGALGDVSAGERVTLLVAPLAAGACARAGTTTTCIRGFTPGDTWMLLQNPASWGARGRSAISFAWLAVLWLPTGLLTRNVRESGFLAVLLTAPLLLLPPLGGFAPASITQIFAALTGLFIGSGLARMPEFGGARPARSRGRNAPGRP